MDFARGRALGDIEHHQQFDKVIAHRGNKRLNDIDHTPADVRAQLHKEIVITEARYMGLLQTNVQVLGNGPPPTLDWNGRQKGEPHFDQASGLAIGDSWLIVGSSMGCRRVTPSSSDPQTQLSHPAGNQDNHSRRNHDTGNPIRILRQPPLLAEVKSR